MEKLHNCGFRYFLRMIYFGKTRFIYTVRTLLHESTSDSWEGLMIFFISKTIRTLSNSLPSDFVDQIILLNSHVTSGEKYAEIVKTLHEKL